MKEQLVKNSESLGRDAHYTRTVSSKLPFTMIIDNFILNFSI